MRHLPMQPVRHTAGRGRCQGLRCAWLEQHGGEVAELPTTSATSSLVGHSEALAALNVFLLWMITSCLWRFIWIFIAQKCLQAISSDNVIFKIARVKLFLQTLLFLKFLEWSLVLTKWVTAVSLCSFVDPWISDGWIGSWTHTKCSTWLRYRRYERSAWSYLVYYMGMM